MGWTSSTAVIGIGLDGALGTQSNNALIVGDNLGNFLEVYGANDTIVGGWGNDSIGAVMYPALGMNGNYVYIDGGAGNDKIAATPIQGEQYATLIGGAGYDTFNVGCNIDSTINAEFADFWVGVEEVRIFYEGYQPGSFTCYSTDKGLLFKDNAGRLNITLDGVYDYNLVADRYIHLYPYGFRGGYIPNSSLQYVTVGTIIKYGGALTGLSLNGNVLTVNDWHSGGVVTNGIYGYEGIVVIDNTQSTQGRFLGGNAQANQIYAGTGGDTLWGAANDDVLIGGAGADVFMYGAGEGSDFVANADAFDTVNLYNLTLSDIAAVNAENNTISLAQDGANAVTIQYNGTLSPTFALADGTRYRFDGAAWQNA